jgi:hypothetical protein
MNDIINSNVVYISQLVVLLSSFESLSFFASSGSLN